MLVWEGVSHGYSGAGATHKCFQVIQELDVKREQVLEGTWQQTNVHFCEMFRTLLPGTEATLQPCEGRHFLDGLEVRVAFGGVWKDSLTELSGGQRSLLALSLILALLKLCPAPVYILDEVWISSALHS
jgi:structural maintenance of chromosome 2